jgi:hypothetical protein
MEAVHFTEIIPTSLTTQCHNPEDHNMINTNVLRIFHSYNVNPLTAAWLICWPSVFLHVMLLGNLLATDFRVFRILLTHEISVVITSFNSMILLLTTCLSISPFQNVINS